MPIGNPQTLKERVDVLERTLLAINCLANICDAAKSDGAELPGGEVAFLLSYLSDSSLYKVEALRVQIHEMPAGADQPPRTERRRKPRVAKLASVA